MNIKLFSNLKWILFIVFLSIFCRLFLISVYRMPTNAMAPAILAGEIIIVSQVAYGFKFPWMESGYFESDPQVGDVIVFKIKNKTNEEFKIQRLVQVRPNHQYVIKPDTQNLTVNLTVNDQIIDQDQIVGKAIVVAVSVGTTQDSISDEKSVRWNRFLTFIK